MSDYNPFKTINDHIVKGSEVVVPTLNKAMDAGLFTDDEKREINAAWKLIYSAAIHAQAYANGNHLAFSNMFDANILLHEAFDAPRSAKRSVRLIREEVNEVIAEAEAPDIDRTKLAHEIADVIMVLFGLAIAAQVSFPDITDAIAIVNKKNAMKTTDTHYLDLHTGKITRLQKLPIKGGGGT